MFAINSFAQKDVATCEIIFFHEYLYIQIFTSYITKQIGSWMTKIIQCLFGDQGSNLIDGGLVIEEIVCIDFYFKHLLNSIFVIFL